MPRVYCAAVSSQGTSESKSARRAHWTLGILLFVYVFNFLDRQVLNVLLKSIKEEFGVSDTLLGFLTGPAFAVFYTVAGLPIARWADRGVRRNIVALGLAAWSVFTMASGVVTSFVQLALARVGVGVGEASATPSAHSMLSDLYPPETRATALSVYTVGAYLGMLGLGLAGWLDENYGWRTAFLVFGAPGLLLALVVRFAVPEPPRGAIEGLSAAEAPPSIREVGRHLLGLRSFRSLVVASSLFAFSGYGFMNWAPLFLQRVHGLGSTQAATAIGFVLGIGGAVGVLLGGILVDRLSRRDLRWNLWIPALGAAVMTPFLSLFLFASDWKVGLLSYFPAFVAGQLYVGPAYAMTQALAKLQMRAQASAVILFFMNLIGMGGGPQLVGLLNDLLAPSFGDQAIRYSLLVMALVNLGALLFSLRAASFLRQDLAEVGSGAD